jgi:hypothetical protein
MRSKPFSTNVVPIHGFTAIPKLIGQFMSRDEAEKDARETLGIVEGER